MLESARGIEGSVIDLETGLRGYIIAGQTRYLDPYRTARATQPARLRRLMQLVADNPSQTALARQLSIELNSYVNDYAVPLIAAVGAHRRIGPRRLSDGKQRVDLIRATIGRFTAAQDALQADRRAAANSATHRARVLTIIGMALLVLVVVASGVYASRFVAEPLRNLARSARRLAAGRLEERVSPRGAAEVSDLGLAFNQMASADRPGLINRPAIRKATPLCRRTSRLQSALPISRSAGPPIGSGHATRCLAPAIPSRRTLLSARMSGMPMSRSAVATCCALT